MLSSDVSASSKYQHSWLACLLVDRLRRACVTTAPTPFPSITSFINSTHLCDNVCRYPVFSRPHKASEWGIWLGRCIAWAKIMGIGTLLQAIGKTREATLLKNAYTAFSVYNTPRYDRSILSAVDNVIALRVRDDGVCVVVVQGSCCWLRVALLLLGCILHYVPFCLRLCCCILYALCLGDWHFQRLYLAEGCTLLSHLLSSNVSPTHPAG